MELKPLIEINYNELSALILKVLKYKAETNDDDFVPYTPAYTKYSVEVTFPNRDLFFGIYSDEKLVGTIGGTLVPILFQGIEMLSSAITFYAIDPDLLPLDREIRKEIFQYLIDKIKEFNVDLIWIIIINQNNKEEAKIFKEDLSFIRINKNVESLVKLLGSKGVDILRKKKKMNIVLAKLAKLMAGMENIDLPGGTIRKATPKDYPKVVELLNAYSKVLPLTQVWTLETFQRYINIISQLNYTDYSALKTEYPNTPFGAHIRVWERDKQIIAAILYRIVNIHFVNGDAPFGFWDYIAFSQDLDFSEKKAFLVTIYNELYLKAIIIAIFLPYYDFKTISKSGFMSERRKTQLLIRPLTDNGKKLLKLEKLKAFYLPSLDFAI